VNETKARVLEVISSRRGQAVSVPEIAAELLLPPDVVYRAVALLLQEDKVQIITGNIEEELQLEAV